MNKDRLIRGGVFYTLAAIVFFSALEAAKFIFLLGSSKTLYSISIFMFSLGYSTLLLFVSYSLGQKLLYEGSRSNKLFTIKRQSMMTLCMLSLFSGLSVINMIVLSEFASGALISSTLTDLSTLSLQYGVTTFIGTLIVLFVVMWVNNLIVDKVKTA
ncbi:hypothetical protein AYY19_04040 [Photobacterium aquimaris]|uniref:Uncharacterized protein n=2 Tax=Photobacterium TaxID=657 RepID=A0A2T3INL3_9GAMM|nr:MULTISPECIES: hypothetical protein [Photobacterium]OBU16337.1 hypothetical protein AYY19_04040 [Photobacterium aquimaris]OBU22340.1 hypothetical protein AYY20_12465 [Photobacterium aquimaris]PSU29926.1 hypothetical protein CTM88_05470 [Photobacterium aquimaris]PSW02258.1 hypothetical protein CTM91_04035 [Photobacterium aquimaris]SMY33771.1 hypothetical protein PMAL9190_01230 [Photobacterium malacitanum]